MTNRFHFDDVIDRRNTNSAKWDTMDEKYGSTDLIHLAVADMDFRIPAPIAEGLHRVVDMGVLGYSDPFDGFFSSIQRWYRRQYRLEIPKEWIMFCPRINISSSICVQELTQPGDRVMIHAPAYGPLKAAVQKNGRELLESPLKRQGDRYTMDLAQMESLVDDKTKMLIMCSPHNPTGRVWTKTELLEAADFCKEHDLLLFSDEIHGDLTAAGQTHHTALFLNEEINDRLIVASSPAKTFNIPGVIVSFLIVPNPAIRSRIADAIDRIGMHNPSIFAITALEKAYTECDDWYEAVKAYIDENEAFTREYFQSRLPQFRILPREGTYLLWIDYQSTGLNAQQMEEWFLQEAKVAVYMGSVFGPEGDGYIRLNLAAPRSVLQQAYDRMYAAMNRLTP